MKRAYDFLLNLLWTEETDACIPWPFTLPKSGYGSVRNEDGIMVPAHREMCRLAHGEPPTHEHEAAHDCGKGHEGCVNPKHLYWATHAENQRDRLRHGTDSRGEKHGKAKITEEIVYAIREARGVEPQRTTAAKFGITQVAVSRVQRKDLWGWLPDKS